MKTLPLIFSIYFTIKNCIIILKEGIFMNKTATLLKFLIPSLIGVFMFLFPMTDADGNTTIPIAYLAGLLLDILGHEAALTIIMVIIVLSALLTMVFSWITRPESKMLADLFTVTPVWVVT